MILRRRTVTIEPDVAGYVESLKPLLPGLDSLWSGVLWHLEHRADEIGEPLIGSTYIAKVKLNANLPIATIVFKMSITSAHLVEIELNSPSQ